MIRSMLVAMDGSPYSDGAGALAIEWGRRFDAAAVAMGMVEELAAVVPTGLGAMRRDWEPSPARLPAAETRIREYLARFRAHCIQAGIDWSTVDALGSSDDDIVAEAAAYDVVVLGVPTSFDAVSHDGRDWTSAGFLRRCPRPLVLVPRAPTEGHGVLVAYGNGPEVARTLQSFTLLGLAGREPVTVLAIGHDSVELARRLRRIEAYLVAHKTPHHLQPIIGQAAPAEIILEEIRRRRPRLVVTGAPGPSGIPDVLSTSALRVALSVASVPVFVGC